MQSLLLNIDLDLSISENMVAIINKSSDNVFTTADLLISNPDPIPVVVKPGEPLPMYNTVITLTATNTSPVPGTKLARYHRYHLDNDFSEQPRTLHVLTGTDSDGLITIVRDTFNLHVDSVFGGSLSTVNGVTTFTLTADPNDLLYCSFVKFTIVFV